MRTRSLATAPPDDDVLRRRLAILTIVREQGYATIEALARRFALSAQTVRRDIVQLDAQGLLQRFHGGAGIREGHVRLGYAEKRIIAADAKERIGRATAALIPEGAAVFLDVGTTVEAVARALRGRRNLRIFTCSLAAATLLAGEADLELVVLGGQVLGADGSLAGAMTTAAIQRFRFDLAVIGFSGFEPDGTFMDFDLQKVAVKQAAMARSRAAIAIGTASKFTRSAIVAIAATDAFTHLVTDRKPAPGVIDALERGGIELITA